MKTKLLFLLFITFSINTFSQIPEELIKENVSKQMDAWNSILYLSDYKHHMLEDALYDKEIASAKAIRENSDYANKLIELEKSFEQQVKLLLTTREYEVYSLISSLRKMEQFDHLANLIDGYSDNEALSKELTDYQVNNILPILRMERFILEQQISRPDRLKLDSLRSYIYDVLDECQIQCRLVDQDLQSQTLRLQEMLANSVSKELKDKNSGINQLFRLADKYEEQIHLIRLKINAQSDRWNRDIKAIQSKYILPTHMDDFKDITFQNGHMTLEHIKKELFFLIMEPQSPESALKILRVGNYFAPYLL